MKYHYYYYEDLCEKNDPRKLWGNGCEFFDDQIK